MITLDTKDPVRIAIYDMDKTITKRPTYVPFLWFAITRFRPWRAVTIPVMIVLGVGYFLKLVGRSQLKELNLALALGRSINQDQLAEITEAFARRTHAVNRLSNASTRISEDRQQGYQLVMATASFRFYAEDIGRDAFGFDSVIGTECREPDAQTLKPAIDGENCYGSVKLRMVKDWLAQQGIARETAHIRFYSDHASDEPCLAWADEAFAVNPHGPLKSLAAKRGWPTLQWA
jgi:HAD superfamily phosphoserine phosphatase-like hydrolase